jgi:hypothetical protein
MPGFLIPLAGLALGALGNLIRNRRAQQALGNATITANASTPAETGLSTAATSGDASPPVGAAQTSGGDRISDQDRGVGPSSKEGPETPPATQPATGPVQQNQGMDSPTPPAGQDAGLAARLGRETVAASKRKNREQKAGVSNAALS